MAKHSRNNGNGANRNQPHRKSMPVRTWAGADARPSTATTSIQETTPGTSQIGDAVRRFASPLQQNGPVAKAVPQTVQPNRSASEQARHETRPEAQVQPRSGPVEPAESAVRISVSAPPSASRQTSVLPEGPSTAHGYLKKFSKMEAVMPSTNKIRISLAPGIVAGMMSRIPVGAATPQTIVMALEAVIMSRASAEQKIEAMLAVSKEMGESISGPFFFDKEMADELLSRNISNRLIGPTKLQQHITDMMEGRWVENGGGITLAKCGLLNDGQHRLHAVSRTATMQRMNLTVGVERDSRRTVDTGRVRNTGDQLRQDGYEKSTLLAALARALISYEYGNGSTLGRPADISSTAIQERAREDVQVQLSTQWAKENQRHLNGQMTGTIAGFMHYLMTRIDPVDAVVYLDGVLTGAENGRGLDVDDPRWVVRERLRREHSSKNSPDRVELLFRGWNAHRGATRNTAIKVQHSFPDLAVSKIPQQR